MDQNTYLGLMALSEGFGNLSNIGAGRPTQQSQVLPLLMQQKQQEAQRAQAMDALRQSGQLEGNPALAALAGQYPEIAGQEMLKAQFRQPGNPYDRYKVVPGVGLVDLAGQNGGPGVAIPAREPAGPQPTALIQEYNFARENGFQGSFEDFMSVKRGPQNPSNDQQAIEDLMASDPNMDYATAVGIVRGRLRMDNFTGQVIDLATNQPWGGNARQQPAPQPGLASPPSGAPSAPGEAFMPAPVVPTDGADYRGATGLQGTVGVIGNAVGDFLGAGLPAPEQAKAEQAYSNLHTRTLSTLQDAFGGRPSNFQLQILQDMTVKPELFGMGPERARLRLEQTRDYIAQAERDAATLASTPGTSRAEVQRARSAIPPLRQLRADYDAIINQFDAAAASGDASRAPAVGTVDGGYRFKGGDPANPSSWERVQ